MTFDRTTHVPALSTDAASPTNAASVTVAVDFGEPIDDATFTLDDISVTGRRADDRRAPTALTVTIPAHLRQDYPRPHPADAASPQDPA